MAPYRNSRILDHSGKPYIMAVADYEGALQGRRLSTWGLSSSGPNTALYGSLANLRARSRELIRNDPQIDGAIDHGVDMDSCGVRTGQFKHIRGFVITVKSESG